MPRSANVALVLARAAPEKRQELALPILRALPNLQVIFCGSGCDDLKQQWLDNPSLELDQGLLDRCRFVAHQSSVTPLLLGADLLLCLSDAEGFPNAVVEAMAHGLPVVATAAAPYLRYSMAVLKKEQASTPAVGWCLAVTRMR